MIDLYNSNIEIGLRILVLLTAQQNLPFKVEQLTFYDHLLLHSGDVEGGPSSIFPDSPFRYFEFHINKEKITEALDLLRRIYDKANIGILLVGMPRLVKNLRGLKGQYAQLYSRVGAAKKLSSLTKADTELILQSSISDKKLAKTYHELSLGNARILSKLIARSVKVAQINELPLNAEVINETSKMLIV